MKFNKLVNNIIKEMLDQHDDIGPDEDPGSGGFTKRLRLEDEIHYYWDKYRNDTGIKPNFNLSDLSIEQLEKVLDIAKQNAKIGEYEPGPFK